MGNLTSSYIDPVVGGKMPDTRTRILIVGEKFCIRTAMSFVLAGIGYRVRTATDSISALREIRQEIPEILLSDLNMPGISGFALLAVVRFRFPSIRVIVMSDGFSGNEVPSGIPADAFYQKGSSTNALLHILSAQHPIKRPVLQPCHAFVPTLIHGDACGLSGKDQMTVTCPENLRAMPQALDGFVMLLRELDSIPCDNSIPCAVIEPTNHLQPFHGETGATIYRNGTSALHN